MSARIATLSIADDIAEDDPIRRLAGIQVKIGVGTVRLAFAGPDHSAFPTGRHEEDGTEVWEIRNNTAAPQ